MRGTGFATLSFGTERDFQVKHESTDVVTKLIELKFGLGAPEEGKSLLL